MKERKEAWRREGRERRNKCGYYTPKSPETLATNNTATAIYSNQRYKVV